MRGSIRNLWLLCLALSFILHSSVCHAHKPSDSYLRLECDGREVKVRWDIHLRDLALVVAMDADDNSQVTWGELLDAQPEIERQLREALTIESESQRCLGAAFKASGIVEHSDGSYAVFQSAFSCPNVPRSLKVRYGFLFRADPLHRAILSYPAGTARESVVFSQDQPEQTLELTFASVGQTIVKSVLLGMKHIGSGWDHLAFLLALLLPSVLRREEGVWRPVQSFRTALFDILRIVTAFTIAHSITLVLGVLELVTLPSRFVESAIALSIGLAALNNLFPVTTRQRWSVAFCLGLLHGFGFSSILVDLNLPRNALLASLFGFNLGVELGQATVVIAFVPIAFLLRRHWAYPRFVLGFGSVLLVIISSFWLVERARGNPIALPIWASFTPTGPR